jgi:hypothetical protein
MLNALVLNCNTQTIIPSRPQHLNTSAVYQNRINVRVYYHHLYLPENAARTGLHVHSALALKLAC